MVFASNSCSVLTPWRQGLRAQQLRLLSKADLRVSPRRWCRVCGVSRCHTLESRTTSSAKRSATSSWTIASENQPYFYCGFSRMNTVRYNAGTTCTDSLWAGVLCLRCYWPMSFNAIRRRTPSDPAPRKACWKVHLFTPKFAAETLFHSRTDTAPACCPHSMAPPPPLSLVTCMITGTWPSSC